MCSQNDHPPYKDADVRPADLDPLYNDSADIPIDRGLPVELDLQEHYAFMEKVMKEAAALNASGLSIDEIETLVVVKRRWLTLPDQTH